MQQLGTMPTLVTEVANSIGRFATSVDIGLSKRSSDGPFLCPSCGFSGRFAAAYAATGRRPYAICPSCGARERHRLQSLVLDLLLQRYDFSKLRVLHMAPELLIEKRFKAAGAEYVSADIDPVGVDLQIDLTCIDQPDDSYDVVYASHVLEHIRDDTAALREIVRILRPGGFAVLPVPLVGLVTIEYPEPVLSEELHVRGPAPDYYDRYQLFFDRVERYSSQEFDEKYQTWVYEDRSKYPTVWCPYRRPTLGARHLDIVPIAYV